MLLKKFKYIILLLLVGFGVAAQTIEGHVWESTEQDKMPVFSANVYWLNSTIGTTTDANGYFSLEQLDTFSKLVISYIGYSNDTIVAQPGMPLEIVLNRPKTLDVTTIEATKSGTSYSSLGAINSINLSGKEFKKAACCNLSESFETNAAVDVNFADGITGAKTIRMLGLDGIYTQLMIENIPSIRGLGRTFGMSHLPGSWLESVQISKGVGTVVNGYEAMAGQINIELKKPDEAERLHFNAYVNHMGRSELNLNIANEFSPRLSTMLMVHGSAMRTRTDMNHDGFLDIPLNQQVNVANRWSWFNKGWEVQGFVRGLYEGRIGGQKNFDPKIPKLEQPWYGMDLNIQRYEGFLKTGKVFEKGLNRSMGWINEAAYHSMEGFFGRNDYKGKNTHYYSNLIFQTNIGSPMHQLKAGGSFLLDDYREQFANVDLKRRELVPGMFGEYQLTYLTTFSLLAGMRLDYHNLYGVFATPRVHLKYSPKEMTTLRASAGRGYRVASILAENTNVLVSSRQVIVSEPLRPEESWTYGGSFTQKWILKNRDFSFNVDFYRTDFKNQVVLDLDQDRYSSIFYNLDGRSYANSLQIEAIAEVVRGLELRLAYKFNDVKTTYQGELRDRLFTPRHAGQFNAAYTTRNKRWLFDATLQLNGRSRLPASYAQGELALSSGYSPVYVTLNAQITRIWKRWEVYIGGENITGYKQHNPIIGYQNPFSPDFDAASIWGPIFGQMAYVGVRYTIPHKYKEHGGEPDDHDKH
ncbi:TonB-dependent receptor [soil metagenome]